MKKQLSLNTLQFVPKIWAVIVYFLLFAVVFLLFYGRKSEAVRSQFFLLRDPEFYSHISNFSISFMLCLVFGFMEILFSGKVKNTLWFAVLLILSNFIYELFIPFINTPDIEDAYYGLAGTLVPFVYFYFFKKFGITENPLYKKD
ncbi:MAG: hypothetical protein PHO74_04535 [Weeksellaceae bacterium]|jgi:hypothetical protein|nr:hypothetical protein [Weeksellaceae bacterium]